MSSQLILDTNVVLDNVEVDYTSLSEIAVPTSRVITLNTTIPRSSLCTVDPSDNVVTASLLSAALYDMSGNPMGNGASVEDVSNNLSRVDVNPDFMHSFASSLLVSLCNEVGVSNFSELNFVGNTDNNNVVPISNLGTLIVRVLEYVIAKNIVGATSNASSINSILLRHSVSPSPFIADILATNEVAIRDSVHTDIVSNYQTPADYVNFLKTATLDTSSNSLNISSRILNSITKAALGSDTSGFTNDKLLKAVVNFMFSAANKFTDVSENVFNRYNTAESSVEEDALNQIARIPVYFAAGDVLYFTFKLTGYKVTSGDSTNGDTHNRTMAGIPQPNNDGQVTFEVTETVYAPITMYLKVTVGQ